MKRYLSSRTLAWHVQGLGFNSQYQREKGREEGQEGEGLREEQRG